MKPGFKLLFMAALVGLALTSCEGAFEGICPVTDPNGMTPPGEQPNDLHHGNGQLYTALWPDGVIPFSEEGPGTIRDDGALLMKFPWWRGEGVRGPLTLHGRDISGQGYEELGSEIPRGYGDTGFQASGLIFPQEGCWEITAEAGEAELVIVVEVSESTR